MGANRAQRRREERETLRRWKEQGTFDQALSIRRNGITAQDLDKAYENGYRDGYNLAAEGFFKQMYAAIAQELTEAGNPAEEVREFLRGVDSRFAVMYDSEEEIDRVYNDCGLRINVSPDALNHVEEI